jgi:hypothetical protein
MFSQLIIIVIIMMIVIRFIIYHLVYFYNLLFYITTTIFLIVNWYSFWIWNFTIYIYSYLFLFFNFLNYMYKFIRVCVCTYFWQTNKDKIDEILRFVYFLVEIRAHTHTNIFELKNICINLKLDSSFKLNIIIIYFFFFSPFKNGTAKRKHLALIIKIKLLLYLF